MTFSQAKELFRSLTKEYFSNATVVFANQSRTAKKELPLVTLAFGNPKRPVFANTVLIDGENVGHYETSISITIDLFTNGAPVEENGRIFAYEDTALDDMMSFADFLDSQYVLEWCNRNDVSIIKESDPQNMSGLINDTSYEYRSRWTVIFTFMHQTVGAASVLSESSIKYPTGEIDKETNEPIYTTERPNNEYSSTGSCDCIKEDAEPVIIPEYVPTASGGGSEELANEDIGYFTEVEIKEDKHNE